MPNEQYKISNVKFEGHAVDISNTDFENVNEFKTSHIYMYNYPNNEKVFSCSKLNNAMVK